ncbi:hypothetical protein CBOM_01063 [Ceraceosorus bombacis]|uniref:Uncharacterized protein n=1 Tax=Ceraceosorus bombacis TaxID=401625 RepID=A0A0P1BAN5_9BASI|nr:hypothetical protein CBOM_01063 [Ceraceosorus bombacis]
MTDASDLSLPSLFSPQSQYDISDITPDSPLATVTHRRRRSCDVPALLQLAPSPFHDEVEVKARMQAPITHPVAAVTQPEVQQRDLSGTRDHKADGGATAAPSDLDYVRLLQKVEELSKTLANERQARHQTKDAQIATQLQLQKSEKDLEWIKSLLAKDEAKKQLADVQKECNQLKEQHRRGQGQLREVEAKSKKDSKDLQDCKTKLSRTEDALCEARKGAKVQSEVRASLVGTAVNGAHILKARKSEPCKSAQKGLPECEQDYSAQRKTSKAVAPLEIRLQRVPANS